MLSKTKKLFFTILAALAGLALLNMLAFGIEYLDYGTYWSNGQPVGLYESHSGARPRLKKGARLDGFRYSVSINAIGFRGPELQSPKPKNGFRVWCIGGSTTFDIYAPSDDKAWPAQLGQLIQEKHPELAVEVINAGIPGEIIRGSIDDVAAFAEEIQPDVIILYHGPNDMQKILSEQRMFSDQSSRGNHDKHQRHSEKTIQSQDFGLGQVLLYDIALFRVMGRWLQTGQHMQISLPDGGLNQQNQLLIQQELAHAIKISRSIGASPVAVSHALRAPPYAQGEEARKLTGEATMLLQLSPESTIRAYATYNYILQTIAQKEGLLFADVRAAVPPDQKYWGDTTHFKEPGSAIAAQRIADTILQSSLIRDWKNKRNIPE